MGHLVFVNIVLKYKEKYELFFWSQEHFNNVCVGCNGNVLGPGQTGNVWHLNNIEYCLVTNHFTIRPPCLVLFDRVWCCLIKIEGHQIFDQKQQKHFFCSHA